MTTPSTMTTSMITTATTMMTDVAVPAVLVPPTVGGVFVSLGIDAVDGNYTRNIYSLSHRRKHKLHTVFSPKFTGQIIFNRPIQSTPLI